MHRPGWDEVAILAREHLEPVGLRPLREAPYTPEEVLVEIETVIKDTAAYHHERPERGERAFSPAQLLAGLRDRERPMSSQALGRRASLFAGWLLRHAARDSFEQTLEAAQLAAVGDPREAALARKLREFVVRYQTGAMDSDEFAAELKRTPRAGKRRPAPPASPDGVPLARAAGELGRLIGDAAAPDEVWRRFRQFAATPIIPPPRQRVSDEDGDLLAFEWGMDEASWLAEGATVFVAAFTRQLAVEEDVDTQPRLVQIECTLAARPEPSLRALEPGMIWSDADRQAWFAEVERSDAFAHLSAAGDAVLRVHVEHDDV